MKKYCWNVFKRLCLLVLVLAALTIVLFYRCEVDTKMIWWLFGVYAAIWGAVDIFWYIFFKPFTEELENQQVKKMVDEIWNEKLAEFRTKQK